MSAPDPPSADTRHRLVAEWDIDAFRLRLYLPPKTWLVPVMLAWMMAAAAASVILGFATGSGLLLVGCAVAATVPLLVPALWRHVNGAPQAVTATQTTLKLGDQELPWSRIAKLHVPSGVKALEVATTDGMVFRLHARHSTEFEDLEWVVASLEHIRNRAKDVGGKADIPESLRESELAARRQPKGVSQ